MCAIEPDAVVGVRDPFAVTEVSAAEFDAVFVNGDVVALASRAGIVAAVQFIVIRPEIGNRGGVEEVVGLCVACLVDVADRFHDPVAVTAEHHRRGVLCKDLAEGSFILTVHEGVVARALAVCRGELQPCGEVVVTCDYAVPALTLGAVLVCKASRDGVVHRLMEQDEDGIAVRCDFFKGVLQPCKLCIAEVCVCAAVFGRKEDEMLTAAVYVVVGGIGLLRSGEIQICIREEALDLHGVIVVVAVPARVLHHFVVAHADVEGRRKTVFVCGLPEPEELFVFGNLTVVGGVTRNEDADAVGVIGDDVRKHQVCMGDALLIGTDVHVADDLEGGDLVAHVAVGARFGKGNANRFGTSRAVVGTNHQHFGFFRNDQTLGHFNGGGCARDEARADRIVAAKCIAVFVCPVKLDLRGLFRKLHVGVVKGHGERTARKTGLFACEIVNDGGGLCGSLCRDGDRNVGVGRDTGCGAVVKTDDQNVFPGREIACLGSNSGKLRLADVKCHARAKAAFVRAGGLVLDVAPTDRSAVTVAGAVRAVEDRNADPVLAASVARNHDGLAVGKLGLFHRCTENVEVDLRAGVAASDALTAVFHEVEDVASCGETAVLCGIRAVEHALCGVDGGADVGVGDVGVVEVLTERSVILDVRNADVALRGVLVQCLDGDLLAVEEGGLFHRELRDLEGHVGDQRGILAVRRSDAVAAVDVHHEVVTRRKREHFLYGDTHQIGKLRSLIARDGVVGGGECDVREAVFGDVFPVDGALRADGIAVFVGGDDADPAIFHSVSRGCRDRLTGRKNGLADGQHRRVTRGGRACAYGCRECTHQRKHEAETQEEGEHSFQVYRDSFAIGFVVQMSAHL